MFFQEAVDLLNRCGFEVIETYGDYAFAPYRKSSELMAFVARMV
jgi:hypothetical protein